MERLRTGRCPLVGRVLIGPIVLLLLFVLSWSVAVASTEDDVRRIAKQLRCPICESVSVADSPSELADQMRGVIRAKLEAGESEQEIIDYFVAAYGDSVLLEPPRRGLSLAAWLVPAAALAVGLVILALLLRSWLRSPPRPARTGGDGSNGRPELTAETGAIATARDELESVRRSLAG